jgi:hypothetical protein
MSSRILKLMFLLAMACVLTRCASDQVDDTLVGAGTGPTHEDDSHGWGANLQSK